MTATPEELSAETRGLLAQWELRPEGAATHGSGSQVLPVRTTDGVPAVMKISRPDAGSEHAHLVLRRWDGSGSVRMLRADPHRRALLLERLLPPTLDTLPDIEACQVVAGLHRRLHVPAMPQLRSLAEHVERWSRDFDSLPRSAPIPRRLVEQASALSRELTDHPTGDDVVLHGDLHYGNVLAGLREPWLAISPKPMNGDPHYELAPMLLHRWDELAGRIRDGLQARFYALVDGAGLDEERARAWVVVRVVHDAIRELVHGARADADVLTRCVTLAKAVQR